MAPPETPPLTVDARGHRCPTPTLKLRRAVERARPGQRIRLLCDDPLARIDVPHYAAEAGLDILQTLEEGGALAFVVLKRP